MVKRKVSAPSVKGEFILSVVAEGKLHVRLLPDILGQEHPLCLGTGWGKQTSAAKFKRAEGKVQRRLYLRMAA